MHLGPELDTVQFMPNDLDSDRNGSWDSDTRFERDLEREVSSAHSTMTPRFRAAYERTMGAVEAFCADKRQAIPVVRDIGIGSRVIGKLDTGGELRGEVVAIVGRLATVRATNGRTFTRSFSEIEVVS